MLRTRKTTLPILSRRPDLTYSARAAGESGGSGGETHIPVLDSLDALNQQLTAAEEDRIAKEAVYRLTKTKNQML